MQNSTLANALAMSASESLSQWTDPEKLIMGASIFVGGMTPNPRGLGNPFKNKSMNQVEKTFEKHVKSGKLISKSDRADLTSFSSAEASGAVRAFLR